MLLDHRTGDLLRTRGQGRLLRISDRARRGHLRLPLSNRSTHARAYGVRRRPPPPARPPNEQDLLAEIYVERIFASLGAVTRACAEAGLFIYALHPSRTERRAQ